MDNIPRNTVLYATYVVTYGRKQNLVLVLVHDN